MFKYTTTTLHKQRKSATDEALEQIEQISEAINRSFEKNKQSFQIINMNKIINELEQDVETQIGYKKNKEFLYANCHKLKRRFYHFRDENKHPRITVCVLYNSTTGISSRGISVCSHMDQTVKEDGRDRAEDRAIKAYRAGKSSERFKRNELKNILGLETSFAKEMKMTDIDRKSVV
jgi:hypothetical protein